MDDRLTLLDMIEDQIKDLREVHRKWVNQEVDPYWCRMQWQNKLVAIEVLARSIPDIPRG